MSGSREWPAAYRARIWRDLDEQELIAAGGRLLVIHGDCPEGADAYARAWVEERQARPGGDRVQQLPMAADWDTCEPGCPPGHRKVKKPGDRMHPGRLPDYCPGAGPRRNAAMIAEAVRRGVAAALVYRVNDSYGASGTLRLIERARIGYTLRQVWR